LAALAIYDHGLLASLVAGVICALYGGGVCARRVRGSRRRGTQSKKKKKRDREKGHTKNAAKRGTQGTQVTAYRPHFCGKKSAGGVYHSLVRRLCGAALVDSINK